MQRARIHSGGGSMPSLQAIDSTPPGPSIDMQVSITPHCYTTLFLAFLGGYLLPTLLFQGFLKALGISPQFSDFPPKPKQ